jgi:predicted kinase
MNTTTSQFISWYHNEFSSDPLFIAMTTCSEASKWHREKTVAIHTNMVVAEYMSMIDHRQWSCDDLLGAIACAFHDVGKPPARTEKHNEERGTYYSYSGHEILSARLWEDWAARNWSHVVELFGLTTVDMYKITWMIEHHRPWGLKDHTKRRNLYMTVVGTVGVEVYTRLLRADNWGRIGDTQDANRVEARRWIEEFRFGDNRPDMEDWTQCHARGQLPQLIDETVKPCMYVMIGCSGSGKSTFANSHDNEAGSVYSWDALRLEWYDPDDYANAYALATADSQFMNKVQKTFMNLLSTQQDIFIDNTNTSAKRRRFYTDEARRKGYRVVGVTFPTSLDLVVYRQSSRPDKSVPYGAVKSQFMNTQQPQLGEFDEIIVTSGNL